MTEHLGFGGDKKVYLFLYQKINKKVETLWLELCSKKQ